MRRYGKRRRFGRRGRRVKAKSKWGWYAKMAFKGVKMLKGIVNAEKHYYTLDQAATGQDYNGTVTLLSGMAQGDTSATRNGNSILAKYLYYRIAGHLSSGNDALIRYIIFKDTENTGSDPASNIVLRTTGSVNAVTSPQYVATHPRFQILRDKIINLSVAANYTVEHKGFIRINDHLKYTGPNASDIYKNAIYILIISNQSVTTNCQTYFSTRLAFYDN